MRGILGLDKPFYVQFVTFITNAVQGNFGISLRLGRPVSALLVERLPATLELAIAAALIGLFVGIPVGVYTALKRDSWISRAMLTTSLVGVSLPNFLIGIFLILIFAVWLGWLPSFGRGDTVKIGPWSTGLLTASGIKALILPSITLGFFPVTLIMRLVRSEMMEVLRTDYIKFARRNLRPRGELRPRPQKHAGPVIPSPGCGGDHRLRHHHRTVFSGRAGLLFVQAVQFADIGDGGVPALLIGLSSWSSTGGGLSLPHGPRLRIERSAAGTLMDAVRRFFDSDVFYSFKHSPLDHRSGSS